MSLIGIIAHTVNAPIQVYVALLLILALAVSTLAVLILKDILISYIKTCSKKMEFIALIISFITIFNFMYIENLYFVECFVMSISLLLYIMAAKEIVYKKNIIRATVYTIIGMFCYQGLIGVLFTMGFLFSILENKKISKEVIKNFIICIIAAVIAIFLNSILIKIIGIVFNLKQIRIINKGIFYNLFFIISKFNSILIKTCGMFPQYLLLLFVFVITVILYVFLLKKIYIYDIRDYFALILITLASGFVTYLLTLTAFYTGRLRFTIGALIGIIYIYIYCRTDIFHKNTMYKKLMLLILIIYFGVNIFNYESLMQQHKLVNRLEQEEAIYIEEKIETYEEDTKQIIQKVGLVYISNNYNYTYYKETPNKCVLTYSALKSDWSVTGAIYYYTGRKLESNKMTEKQYINLLEELKLQDDDVVFIGDTMYLKIFMY